MFRKSFRMLTTIVLASLLLVVVLGSLVVPARSQDDNPKPILPQPNARLDAVRQGKWPAQVAAHSGSVRPDRHGPQRNDPAEGIPAHAYSPFDERVNREHPCPPGGCEFEKGRVVVKLAPQVRLRGPNLQGAWTEDATLNKALAAEGVVRLEPIFSNAKPPKPGAFVASPQGERLPKPDLTRWHRAILREEKADVYATVQALSEARGIAWAEPDYLRNLVGEPENAGTQGNGEPWVRLGELKGTLGNSPSVLSSLSFSSSSSSLAFTDPLYPQQWHLSAANVPQAWQWLEDNSYTPGGSRDIVVAVIDTGVDYTHPDLAANMWVNAAEFSGTPGVDDDGNGYVDDIYGADTVYPDGDPQDDHGHGTHVAGIIAAQANNGEGGVGVAYNVQLMAIKAAQYSGVLASSDIAEAIYYAVQQGADVINMSFGGYARSQLEEDALAVAFGQAVLVAAAGNDGKVNLPCPFGRDMYPAAYNWVLGVMASTSGGSRALFSNKDCTPHDSHEYELMAPGVDVWSTLPSENYAAWDGTSMATPVVSGIAALLRTKWSDKDVYSSRFIMGQIAANAAGGTGGVADAHAALTVAPQPELSYLEHWLFDTEEQSPDNDDDGIVDAGETVDLAIVIRNHWGKADPVTVTLEAWAEGAVFPDPYVTMITDTVSYGAVGSFNQDDNGLIYDDEGVITGVRHPFCFTVPITTPNDHVIPFLLTMTAGNGYDTDDPNAPYVFQSRFYLIVQRGTELPRIISEDMTLTKDYYWIVPGQVLIEASATVSVSEGTQVQWGSPDPDDPYGGGSTPLLQVEGTLLVEGTQEEPPELFPSSIINGGRGKVRVDNYGAFHLQYAKVQQPEMGTYGIYRGPNSIDHSYFFADFNTWDSGFSVMGSPGTTTNSIVRYWEGINGFDPGIADTNLFQATSSARGYPFYVGQVNNSVFLQNNTENRAWSAYFQNGPDIADSEEAAAAITRHRNNAFLSKYWDPDVNHWMRVTLHWSVSRSMYVGFAHNYWGTESTTLIDAAIVDFYDDFNKGTVVYQPILTTPATTTYPFVVDVLLSTTGYSNTSALHGPTPIVGAETVTFTVTFNRDMDTTVQPAVSFGPDVPETDYTVHPVDGGWQDLRTWMGTFNITPITGDGYQLMRIADAVAADDPWLVTGEDVERFRFEIITSGTEAMNLQATGGEGYVDLMWTQDDFDLLAGFNLYRSTSQDGTYIRINDSILPPDQRTYRDTDVQPGQPYYYKFTVVKTDMTESDFSNVATATPVDTVPPVISHTPVTEAPPGLPLTLYADVTDNVGVQGVTLYYRAIGAADYLSRTMTNTTGDRYSATIEGSQVTSPGLEYYIEADDGVSTVQDGRPEYPHQITVVDKPVVTIVSPDHGPASGGTAVTISGSNFKDGASVTFGSAVAEDATVVSSSQITATTPAHYPATVDVTVTNPDDQSGTLLRGFTYESEVASLSLPDTGGGQHDIVQVPVNAANVQGLAAASLTVTFDSGVLSARDASTGNLTPGWSLAANTSTSGEIRVSMASPGGTVTGSGVLAYLEFEVVGSPGASTTLQLTNVSLNDGAIPTETANGSFTVNLVYDVAGTVRFWENSAGVPGILLTLQGDRVYTDQSDANGDYTVSGAGTDDYSLTPSKSDGVNGIGAYDASQALQHDAGLAILSGYAATAGDVNKNGSITSMDAFYILQKAVDLITLPFPGAGVVWDFDPTSRSYTNLSSDQTGQDFTAVLLGDTSGNWSAGGGGGGSGPAIAATLTTTATLSLPQASVLPSQQVTVPLTLNLPEGDLYGADIVLSYDTAVVSATAVVKGSLATGWSMASNLTTPGVVRVAMAGATPITSGGELLLLVFNAVGSAGSDTDLTLTRGDLNEGGIPADLQHGNIYIARPVQAAFTASPTVGVAPLTVVFTNTSTGDFDTCAWTFGDGGTSSNCNDPSHTYTTAGVHTVTLAVSGLGGSDTETKVDYIIVYLLDISGEVRFWQDAAGVPGVLLNLQGDSAHSGTSNTAGAYTVSDVSAGDYTLTPSKSDGVNGITAYDASFVLRHAAGLITLTSHQATAAEVTKNGGITSMDASYILQKAVELITLPFPDASVVWGFDPASRSYTDLSSDQAGQDFTAVLLGDVSGNWSAGGGQAMARAVNTASLSLPDLYAEPGERITVTLSITVEQSQLYAADLVIGYDSEVLNAVAVTTGEAAEGFLIASNLTQPGTMRVGLAGSEPLTGAGVLLNLGFEVVGELGDATALSITGASLNEDGIAVQPVDGAIRVVDLPACDFDRDCQVTSSDIMQQAAYWRIKVGDPDYDAVYDQDNDGDIDIADIMAASSTWGERCVP